MLRGTSGNTSIRIARLLKPELVEHDARRPLERATLVRVAREPILDTPARDQQMNALVAILDEAL